MISTPIIHSGSAGIIFFILLLHQRNKNDAKKAKLGSEIQVDADVSDDFQNSAASVVAGASWNLAQTAPLLFSFLFIPMFSQFGLLKHCSETG